MNAKTGTAMARVALALTFCLVSLEPLALAQSSRGFLGQRGNSARATSAQSPNSHCRKLKGIRTDVFDPAAGTVFGTITNSGILNGTTATVLNFNLGFVFTPDPNVIAYLSDTAITTNRGQLKASLVTTFNFVTGAFTEWGNIDPNTSTGRFAGATGVIFFDGKSIGDPAIGPYKSVIVGDICLAHDDGMDENEDVDGGR